MPMAICSKVSAAARQGHRPGAAADDARLDPDPGHIADQRQDGDEGGGAIEPHRKLVDIGRGFRMPGDAEPEHRGVAEPEGEAGEKADLGDVDRIQPPCRIDAVAHRAAGEDAGADIVADRVGGEAGQRVDAVGHVGAADRAHGKPVVEGEREITERHEQGGKPDLARLGSLDGVEHLGNVDAAKHVVEHIAGDADDRDADRNTHLMQDLLVAQERDEPAYGFQHLDLEYRCDGSDRLANLAAALACALLPGASGSAFRGETEFTRRRIRRDSSTY